MTDGRGAQLFEQTFDVEAVQISFQTVQGQADATNHQSGERAVPAGDAEPATSAACAIADDVDVHVYGRGRRGGRRVGIQFGVHPVTTTGVRSSSTAAGFVHARASDFSTMRCMWTLLRSRTTALRCNGVVFVVVVSRCTLQFEI